MKRLSEYSTSISAQHIKKCPFCEKKVKGHKKHTSKNGKFSIEVPVWNCLCYYEKLQKRELKKFEKQVNVLFKQSNIDEHFLTIDFPFSCKELEDLNNDLGWIKKGKQFFVYGDAGNYKTTQVVKIAKNAICREKTSVLYYRASELPNLIVEDKKILYRLERCDLLILDNFGKEKAERFAGKNFDLLDKRIHNYKSNILICNNPRSQVESIYSAPMISRLNMFEKIEIDGEDKRGIFEKPDEEKGKVK